MFTYFYLGKYCVVKVLIFGNKQVLCSFFIVYPKPKELFCFMFDDDCSCFNYHHKNNIEINEKQLYIMFRIRTLVVCISLVISVHISAQKVAVKTNLLYGGLTFTPNLGAEFGLSPKITLDISGGYNPWNREGSLTDNKKLVHWLVEPELRYWFCRKFNGHFLGTHLLYSQYNISDHDLPLLFGKHSSQYRFEGNAAGGGLSYGYQFPLSSRWSLEASIGVGYARLWYNKFNCHKCSEKIGKEHRNYFGPTKAGISIIYIIK